MAAFTVLLLSFLFEASVYTTQEPIIFVKIHPENSINFSVNTNNCMDGEDHWCLGARRLRDNRTGLSQTSYDFNKMQHSEDTNCTHILMMTISQSQKRVVNEKRILYANSGCNDICNTTSISTSANNYTDTAMIIVLIAPEEILPTSCPIISSSLLLTSVVTSTSVLTSTLTRTVQIPVSSSMPTPSPMPTPNPSFSCPVPTPGPSPTNDCSIETTTTRTEVSTITICSSSSIPTPVTSEAVVGLSATTGILIAVVIGMSALAILTIIITRTRRPVPADQDVMENKDAL